MAIQAEKTVSRLLWAYYAADICGATLLSPLGVEVVGEIAKTEKLPNPEFTTNLGFYTPSRPIVKIMEMSHRIKAIMHGVSEETTTGVKKKASGILLFAAINFDDSVTKSKWDDLNGWRPSLADRLIDVEDFTIADKGGVECGGNPLGGGIIGSIKGRLMNLGCATDHRVLSCLPQLDVEDFTIADKGGVECAGNPLDGGIIGFAKGRLMNLGCATDHPVLSCLPQLDVEDFTIADKGGVECGGNPLGGGIIGFAKGRLMNLGCATDHPVLSCLPQLELWNEKKSGKYEEKVYVAALNLQNLGAKLTKLSPE